MSLLPGPEKDYCGCGCGIFGTLGRPDRDQRRHARGCGCRVCMGRRNRRSGLAKQRTAAKRLGVPASPLRPGNEEHYGGALRMEVKSGAQVGPMATRFDAARAQSEAARPFGDNRPFVFVAMPAGSSDGIAACRLSDLPAVAAAVLENLGGEW